MRHCGEEAITAADVGLATRTRTAAAETDPYSHSASFDEFKDTAEREFLVRRLHDNGWNVKRTAELLGMQRSNLYKKIDKYGLKKPGKK